MGAFSLISLGVSTVFPIIASYRALEECNGATSPLTAASPAASLPPHQTSSIASPLEFVFRRLSGCAPPVFSSEYDASRVAKAQLSFQTMQMWFVYWIVFAVSHLIEQVFMLRFFVPFYGLLKITLCLWLMWPIVFLSAQDPPSSLLLHQEWEIFTKNGAGKIYYEYIAPTLEGNIGSARAGQPSEHIVRVCRQIMEYVAHLFPTNGAANAGTDTNIAWNMGRLAFTYVASFSRAGSHDEKEDSAEVGVDIDQGTSDSSYILVKNATSKTTDENSPAQFESHLSGHDELNLAGPRLRASHTLWW